MIAFAVIPRSTFEYRRLLREEVGAHSLADVLRRRAVPVAYYEGQQSPGMLAPHRGWTPPYWFAPWWRDCVVPRMHIE